ncbi:lipopolysaccharide biosynthesis protein [Desulfogranum japonicum]|uniref:lipopolysaccharide biosynthesis protein n=1 Tax=Desulfogranum japonicum TaxID=231447 RepID=UPI00040D7D7A|nr:oligosaccharide flippase family protein [Desulfogranum japonicum]
MSRIKVFFSRSASQGSFLRSIAALVTGTASAQVIAILASPLLTRLYNPEDFGVLSVFIASLGALSVVSCGRYELAIPIVKTTVAALNILALAVLINLACCIICAGVVIGFRSEISIFFNVPHLARHLWVLPVGIVLVSTYRSLTFLAIRDKQFGTVARTKFTQALSGVGLQLGFGALHSSALGLILGNVAGQSAGVVFLGQCLIKRFKPMKSALRFKRVAAVAILHSRFPKYDMPAAGINTLAANLPQFLLPVVFSPVVAGLYLLAYRVISMPVAVVGQAVGQALYSHAREASVDGKLTSFVGKIAISLGSLTILPLFILFFFGEDLFTLLFGATWSTAGIYAGWLMLGAAVQFVYSPISLMLLATNSQHINLIIQIFLFLAKSASIAFGYFSTDPLVTIKALAIADMTGYLFGVYLTFRQVTRWSSCRKQINGE